MCWSSVLVKILGFGSDFFVFRPQIGYRYLDASLLEEKFELQRHEIFIYGLCDEDLIKSGAVEYVMPIAEIKNSPAVPEGFTTNREFSVPAIGKCCDPGNKTLKRHLFEIIHFLRYYHIPGYVQAPFFCTLQDSAGMILEEHGHTTNLKTQWQLKM